jgi:hypothetical protein
MFEPVSIIDVIGAFAVGLAIGYWFWGSTKAA